MEFQALYPEHETITIEELRDRLNFRAPRDDRPHVLANFISSADGRAAIQGRSAPLSSDGDRAMFHTLRERVDAIIAGTGTLKAERYGRLIRDEDAQRRRVERGLEAQPLACVVSRSGMLPLDIPLFEEERVVLFAPETVGAVETVLLDPDEITPATVLNRLRTDYGVSTLLCEGGPTLFGSLIHERVVDELFLTLSPKLAGGGTAPTISSGTELASPAALEPTWVLERAGSLFLRFTVL